MNTQESAAMPVIQTERLIINPLTLDDIPPFYAYRTHPDVVLYQGEFPRSEEDVRKLIDGQSMVSFGTIGQWFQFAIRLLPDQILIGDIALHFNSQFISQVEIAYSLNPAYQHKGYASEGVRAVLDYCLSTLNMKVVSATIDVRNTASRHLLQKMDFQRMANRPHACFIRGEWCDEEDYALFSPV